MKGRRLLNALLMLMLIACLPANAWATVTQTVTAGFNEGQGQNVLVEEDVEVNGETNAILVQAYAPEEMADKNASVKVKGNVTLTNTGDISAVYAEGRNGDASVEITGDLSGTSDGDAKGIETWGHSYEGNGEVNVKVGGNVSAESSLTGASGIDSYRADINALGDVTAKGKTAIGVKSYNDNKLTVGGNVTSEGESSTGMDASTEIKSEIDVKGGVYSTGNYTKGLQIEAISFSDSSVTADLSVTAGNGIHAVMAETDPEAWYSANGISFYNDGGKLLANIKGDVEAKATNDQAVGIRTDHSRDESGRPFGNGTSEILVHGNVISDGVGVVLDTFGEITGVNVLVENEIQAKKAGVLIGRTWFADEDSETEPKLTVWKIDLNDRGKAVEWGGSAFGDIVDDEQYKAKAVADFEKHIMYIAKVEQPSKGGTLKVVDANGNDLSKSYDFPVAHEGDKVILKANLQSGWKIKAAYNGTGTNKQQLSKDENGNYYIIVPKGGGIYLSADLEKDAAAAADAKAKKVKTVTVNAATVNAKAIDKAVKKAGGSEKYVTKIVLGKKVKKISAKSFAKYKKVTTLEVKTKKLKAKTVKGSLKGSKVKTVLVKIGSKKVNKKFVKNYKKIFTKKNAGKKANVK